MQKSHATISPPESSHAISYSLLKRFADHYSAHIVSPIVEGPEIWLRRITKLDNEHKLLMRLVGHFLTPEAVPDGILVPLRRAVGKARGGGPCLADFGFVYGYAEARPVWYFDPATIDGRRY